jgi:Lycopene cyclase
MQYAYLIWSLLLLVLWLALYFSLRDRENRREMLMVSLFTAPLGLTEPIFVPEYWLPPIPDEDRHSQRHRFHLPVLVSAPVLFVILFLTTSWNPIYTTSLALLIGGVLTWYCRPDLARSMLVTGILFGVFYFVFFLSLVFVFPEYVGHVWNLDGISGTLVAGVPVEEFLFAFSLGFVWSSAYEHIAWRTYDHAK